MTHTIEALVGEGSLGHEITPFVALADADFRQNPEPLCSTGFGATSLPTPPYASHPRAV